MDTIKRLLKTPGLETHGKVMADIIQKLSEQPTLADLGETGPFREDLGETPYQKANPYQITLLLVMKTYQAESDGLAIDHLTFKRDEGADSENCKQVSKKLAICGQSIGILSGMITLSLMKIVIDSEIPEDARLILRDDGQIVLYKNRCTECRLNEANQILVMPINGSDEMSAFSDSFPGETNGRRDN